MIKIAGLVGNPLKVDKATTQNDRLKFARVLVEMPLDQSYPSGIMM